MSLYAHEANNSFTTIGGSLKTQSLQFHFVGNHLLDGGEYILFLIPIVALLTGVGLLVDDRKKHADKVLVCALVFFFGLFIAMHNSGAHYDVQYVKGELESQGLNVVRSNVTGDDKNDNTVTFGNGGCELGDFKFYYEKGTVRAYVRRGEYDVLITPQLLERMCASTGG